MSAMSVEDQIAKELDDVLRACIKADGLYRDARRVLDNAEKTLVEREQRAQRLRMALYQLRGEGGGTGDANVDNNRRRAELLRPPADVDGRDQQ